MEHKKLHIVLHAHLPFVLGHGKWPHGNHWLCEAVVHCYLPLIKVLEQLPQHRLACSVVLTPVLCEQLQNTECLSVVKEFCQQQLLTLQEPCDEQERYWAQFYQSRLEQLESASTILSHFVELRKKGVIQVLTCAATHAYLPLLGLDGSIALQYWCARQQYQHVFGDVPVAAWVPECAVRPNYSWCSWLPDTGFNTPRYRKGVLQLLQEQGILATVVEQDTLLHSEGYNRANTLRPGIVHADNQHSLLVYGRHSNASWQVWSSVFGYPGDFNYLEFHKRSEGSGIRKWRITGEATSLDEKQLYSPTQAQHTASVHADNWVSTLSQVLQSEHGEAELTVAFDAELFGHWWHEGPTFLERVVDNIAKTSLTVQPLGDACNSAISICDVHESSWGDQGNHNTWMNEQTYWLWQRLYQLEIAVRAFVQSEAKNAPARVTAQVLRELMLAQASDWPFLITQGDAKEYAEQRFHCHEQDALKLMRLAKEDMNSALKQANRCFEQNPVFGFLEEELSDALASFLNEPADAGL